MGKPSVLVVNSLVARGSVGGRASVFALERLGFPVIFVPTVMFPWHLGHGRATRVAPDAAGFESLLADIAGAAWLGEVGAVLTGYFGRADQVAPAARLVAAVKAANKRSIHLCDPIIGDTGGLFQPEALAAAIRDQLLPLADVATPNDFELHWLTGMDGDSIAAARELRPGEVVVTSAAADRLSATIETLVTAPEGSFRIAHRWLPENAVHGTGDLFAALYLGHRLDGAAPQDAAASAAASVYSLLEMANRVGLDELPLAAGQDAMVAQPTGVTVTKLAEG